MARQARQLPYVNLFQVGDFVEVAQAPLDGETKPQWLAGRVIRISTRLHVLHCLCSVSEQDRGCGCTADAYDRAMYNRGFIRKGKS